MPGPTVDFWNERFRTGTTGWDRGAVHPRLQQQLGDGTLKPCRILVPGCGAGHEVLALATAGFDVTALDYADEAVQRVRTRLAASGLRAEVVQADVRNWQPAQPFDAVWEQTCLCALYPDDWPRYGAQLHRWLAPGGWLHVLFMQVPRPGAAQGWVEGPPYHCDINAMRAVFPATHWRWPKPPYAQIAHGDGPQFELGLVLERTPG
ncbi:methyltransferase domain-containing protein [Thiomonas sp.]|jgi:SAM-dependent methyltransferase|uniref:methyltransferase domain-containing protein n=1 Tax=Thiomonas sp. TaxID=2047785 RepID=UPI0026035AB6|nr:methyltransferase domain-containing protein [Thiomonas sp.]